MSLNNPVLSNAWNSLASIVLPGGTFDDILNGRPLSSLNTAGAPDWPNFLNPTLWAARGQRFFITTRAPVPNSAAIPEAQRRNQKLAVLLGRYENGGNSARFGAIFKCGFLKQADPSLLDMPFWPTVFDDALGPATLLGLDAVSEVRELTSVEIATIVIEDLGAYVTPAYGTAYVRKEAYTFTLDGTAYRFAYGR